MIGFNRSKVDRRSRLLNKSVLLFMFEKQKRFGTRRPKQKSTPSVVIFMTVLQTQTHNT